jgi:hypothetical protein
LLTRAGCGLCEEFELELAAFAATSGLSLPPLQILDVDEDAQLARRYGLDIPVLLWGGALVCQHRLDREELRRMLRPRQAPTPQ